MPYAAREGNGGRPLPFPPVSSSTSWRCNTPGIAHGCDTELGYFLAIANKATAKATHAVPMAMNGGEYSAHCTKASSRLRGFSLVFFLMSISMASVKSCGETIFLLLLDDLLLLLLLLLDFTDDDSFLPTEGELSFEDEGALVLPARRGAFVNGLSTVPLVSFKASCTLEEDREEDEDFFDA